MSEAEGTSGIFRKEGEYWTIAWGSRLIRLRDCKGLGYLSLLLRTPYGEFPVGDLVGEARGSEPKQPLHDPRRERQRVMVTKAIRTALRKIAEHEPALGEPLQSAVRTGKVCSYVPSPVEPESLGTLHSLFGFPGREDSIPNKP